MFRNLDMPRNGLWADTLPVTGHARESNSCSEYSARDWRSHCPPDGLRALLHTTGQQQCSSAIRAIQRSGTMMAQRTAGVQRPWADRTRLEQMNAVRSVKQRYCFLPNSREYSPSGEADCRSVRREISHIYTKSLLMDMARQMILSFDLNKHPHEFSPPPHTLFSIHFNIILMSVPRSSYMFPYLLPTKTFSSTTFVPHASPIPPSLILPP